MARRLGNRGSNRIQNGIGANLCVATDAEYIHKQAGLGAFQPALGITAEVHAQKGMRS